MLNKSKSFKKVVTKYVPIHTELSKELSKSQGWEGVYKKTYVGVREIKFGKRVKNVWKILKLSTNSIKLQWRQQLSSEISIVKDI